VATPTEIGDSMPAPIEVPTPEPKFQSGINIHATVIPDNTLNEYAERAHHHHRKVRGLFGGRRGTIPKPFSKGSIETRELAGKKFYVVKGAVREAMEREGNVTTIPKGALPKDQLPRLLDHDGHPLHVDSHSMTEQLRKISVLNTQADQLEEAGQLKKANALRKKAQRLISKAERFYGYSTIDTRQ